MSSVGSKRVIIQDADGGDAADVILGSVSVCGTDSGVPIFVVNKTGTELDINIESIDSEVQFSTVTYPTNVADEGGVAIGNTSTQIFAANILSRERNIVNDSDVVIYLGFDTAAVMNEGVRLNPNGGSWSSIAWTGIVHGICASTGKNVTYSQFRWSGD